MRTRLLVFAAVLSFGSACSDAPVGLDANQASTRLIAPPGTTLDQNIYSLFQLYPAGLRTAGLNRWNTIKSAYAAGRLDQSKSQLLSLSSAFAARASSRTART